MYATLEARGKGNEVKLTKKNRVMQAMKQKYKHDIQTILDGTDQLFNQIMATIQYSPKLAQGQMPYWNKEYSNLVTLKFIHKSEFLFFYIGS